jgi:beta-glucanase (GH16 family)
VLPDGIISRRALGAVVLASGIGWGLAACVPATPRRSSSARPGSSGSATPSASAAPSGSPAPSASGLVWSDEFDGAEGTSPSSALWAMANGVSGANNELEGYSPLPRSVSLDGGGSLRLTARRETYTGPLGRTAGYSSGKVQSVVAFRYGRIEARIKVPAGDGLWPAFWMLGKEDASVQWPQSGEIDIMETSDAATSVQCNVHADSTTSGSWTDAASLDAPGGSWADDWHVYAVDWSTDRLVFSIDGREYHTVERAGRPSDQVWEFDRPQYILLNLAIGGDYPRRSPDGTSFPVDMLVDWVRVHDAEIHPQG